MNRGGNPSQPLTAPLFVGHGHSSRFVEEEETNDYREGNRADASGTAEKDPGNYFWGGPSVHANVGCWVWSVTWSRTSSYDSDHIAADFP